MLTSIPTPEGCIPGPRLRGLGIMMGNTHQIWEINHLGLVYSGNVHSGKRRSVVRIVSHPLWINRPSIVAVGSDRTALLMMMQTFVLKIKLCILQLWIQTKTNPLKQPANTATRLCLAKWHVNFYQIKSIINSNSYSLKNVSWFFKMHNMSYWNVSSIILD